MWMKSTEPIKHDFISPSTARAAKDIAIKGQGKGAGVLDGVVAVVGCDGTGKTRLAHDLLRILQQRRPTERKYMGLISGESGDKIKALPIIGVMLENYLAGKVRRAQDMEKKLPGAFTGLVMYLFSQWRVLQMQLLKRRARNGTLMIAERYPQAEIAGFHYDGPGLDADRSKGWLVQKLARHEQKIYQKMADNKPMLIIRLLIDEETAYARKSDHPLAELRDKILKMPTITYNGAHIVEIDSRMPYEDVLKQALDVIEDALHPKRRAAKSRTNSGKIQQSRLSAVS